MSEDTDRATAKPPSVDRLSQLWRRINDHKMVQWSVAYVALAYGVQHGVVLTSEAFDWPHAVTGISMLLLALGLPLVMTFAWYHGERASRQFTKAELSILSALLVIGSLLFYAFVQPSAEVAAGPRLAVQQASVAAARAASASVGNAISIAVLPFLNLSRDPDQEFFSDGMTEEITSALAKVPDLRVVARTSAFEFKGKNVNIKAMGLELGATHLIEGSVRKAGNRLRITAQLIKADDGTHIWAESYDRDLTDIFAVQEDIARAITASLRMPLGLAQGESLVRNRTKDEATYENYLRAKALVRARGLGPLAEATKLLEDVVARDPDFSPAWALLGLDYVLTVNYHPAFLSGAIEQVRPVVETVLPKAEAAGKRAIVLDPKNPNGYATLGFVEFSRGKFLSAGDLYREALALDAEDPDALSGYSLMLSDLGYEKQALADRQRLEVLEPYVSVFNRLTAYIFGLNGQNETAVRMLKALPPETPLLVNNLAVIYAKLGRYGQAADLLLSTPPGTFLPGTVEAAARQLRSAPATAAAPQSLPQLGAASFVYLYGGAPEGILGWYEDKLKIGFTGAGWVGILWTPEFAAWRKTERFKAYMRAVGMVDYWRKNGWPDLCRPMGADDFVCD
jgi:TolB-like protein/Flp pilus assembly protein TadD